LLNHVFHYFVLLEILLAEARHIGLYSIKELFDNLCNALKMPRPMWSFKFLFKLTQIQVPLFALGVHLGYFWLEENIASRRFKQSNIVFNRAWVFFKILWIVELSGIDENAAYHHIS